MDFETAEQRYGQLKTQRSRGELAEIEFRVEVAKLLLRDAEGSFWMLDPETGDWFRNEGQGWVADDPYTGPEARATRLNIEGIHHGKRRVAALTAILVGLVAIALAILLLQWPTSLWSDTRPLPTAAPVVEVSIASPADGSTVAAGQRLGIESMLVARTGLQSVASVELLVGGEVVETRPVGSRVQPGQTSLPLSLPWRPSATGEYAVAVSALSETGESLGQASISLLVAEAADAAQPPPACMLDATFLTDITIPDGTGFPPGAQMTKVWQVRNSGTCAWDTGYELVHLAGDLLGADSPIKVPATAAGERANLEAIFMAPEQAGTYSSTWQLRSPTEGPFGPRLSVSVSVETEAKPRVPPVGPGNVGVAVTEDGKAVHVTWEDLSDNEDGFRIYREDVEASIGLVPANAELFVDRTVACGHAYSYGVAAFNASGASSLAEAPEVVLPACASNDQPPTLILTVVPTQVVASETFTIVFQAMDDIAVRQVIVQGESTGDPELDAGRTFPCSGTTCTGSWAVSLSQEASTTLILTAVAADSAGQDSEPARTTVVIEPADRPVSGTEPRPGVLLPQRAVLC
jgi:hypothetical protein